MQSKVKMEFEFMKHLDGEYAIHHEKHQCPVDLADEKIADLAQKGIMLLMNKEPNSLQKYLDRTTRGKS